MYICMLWINEQFIYIYISYNNFQYVSARWTGTSNSFTAPGCWASSASRPTPAASQTSLQSTDRGNRSTTSPCFAGGNLIKARTSTCWEDIAMCTPPPLLSLLWASALNTFWKLITEAIGANSVWLYVIGILLCPHWSVLVFTGIYCNIVLTI